jgi:hypothetical protein
MDAGHGRHGLWWRQQLRKLLLGDSLSEDAGHVKQQFGLTGIEHEPAFKKSDAGRKSTLYAILRIGATAREPT